MGLAGRVEVCAATEPRHRGSEEDAKVGRATGEVSVDSGFGASGLIIIGRLHRTRTTGIRSTGLVRQDRQILTNKDK